VNPARTAVGCPFSAIPVGLLAVAQTWAPGALAANPNAAEGRLR
jgi:hypothetical protein